MTEAQRGPKECQQELRGDGVKVSSEAPPGLDTAERDQAMNYTAADSIQQIPGGSLRTQKSIRDWHEARRPPLPTPHPTHAETTLERKRGGSQICERLSILFK